MPAVHVVVAHVHFMMTPPTLFPSHSLIYSNKHPYGVENDYHIKKALNNPKIDCKDKYQQIFDQAEKNISSDRKVKMRLTLPHDRVTLLGEGQIKQTIRGHTKSFYSGDIFNKSECHTSYSYHL